MSVTNDRNSLGPSLARQSLQRRDSRHIAEHGEPMSSINKLVQTVRGHGFEDQERIDAAHALAGMKEAARPAVKWLGIAGAQHPKASVQTAIIVAINAAGGPLAQDALAEIRRATISSGVKELAEQGIAALRSQEAAQKQQPARKLSKT